MMPRLPCIERGCREYAVLDKSRCALHQREWDRSRWDRGATGQRGSRPGWRKLRARVIREQGGRCYGVIDDRHPCTAPATHVHHKDGNARNDERSNLIGLCEPCHRAAHNGQRADKTNRAG